MADSLRPRNITVPTVFEPALSSVFPNITGCIEILTLSNRRKQATNKTIPTDTPAR